MEPKPKTKKHARRKNKKGKTGKPKPKLSRKTKEINEEDMKKNKRKIVICNDTVVQYYRGVRQLTLKDRKEACTIGDRVTESSSPTALSHGCSSACLAVRRCLGSFCSEQEQVTCPGGMGGRGE